MGCLEFSSLFKVNRLLHELNKDHEEEGIHIQLAVLFVWWYNETRRDTARHCQFKKSAKTSIGIMIAGFLIVL